MPLKTLTGCDQSKEYKLLSTPIRVVVADDSPFVRKAISLLLEDDPDIQVVGVARDGRECLDMVETLRPDVLTLDLNMPLMDGLSVLRILNHECSIPVIMISSLTVEGAEATLEALEQGAIDFIAKQITPKSLFIDLFKEELTKKVKWAAQQHRPKTISPDTASKKSRRLLKTDRSEKKPVEIVGIGASTGGPIALQKIIPMLPPDFPVPMVVAQHIPAQFSLSLADRLNKKSHLIVREARHGDRLTPGTVLIAPGGQHLEIKDNQNIKLIPNEKGNLACPSVNRLLTSMAECFGPGSLGVILTGMGDDGVEGSRMIQRHGGQILVQDEETSLAYSMPRYIVEQELADCEAPVTLIAAEILRML